jgi:hypothetical protein
VLCEASELAIAEGVRALIAAPRRGLLPAADTDAAWRAMAAEMIARLRPFSTPRTSVPGKSSHAGRSSAL